MRAGILVFEAAHGQEIMRINETLFQALDAEVDVTPVLTLDELHKGFE